MKRMGSWLLVAALAGCAAPGPRTTVISQDKLQSLLAARFPYTGKIGPLFELQAQAPQVRLLPAQNRLGTAIQVQVTERLTRAVFNGVLDVDYAVQFEPSDSTIRMADVHVNTLGFTGVPERYQAVVQGLAPQLAERVLDGVKLHQVSAKDMAVVNGWGYEPGTIEVTAAGLRITLNPKKAP
ncbi:hypothetical protein os1_27070 [Comamonadaceae bacterium OS-1]|nr:hypothetical protein os1_27070 [Comamonadaceae bacterium OS-1]